MTDIDHCYHCGRPSNGEPVEPYPLPDFPPQILDYTVAASLTMENPSEWRSWETSVGQYG